MIVIGWERYRFILAAGVRLVFFALVVFLFPGLACEYEGKRERFYQHDEFNLGRVMKWNGEEFDQVLGNPHSCTAGERGSPGLAVCYYQPLEPYLYRPAGCEVGQYRIDFAFEVAFRNNQLEYLIINGGGVEFRPRVLEFYGLGQQPEDTIWVHPSEEIEGMVWKDYKGYEYVVIYTQLGIVKRVEANVSGIANWSSRGYLKLSCGELREVLARFGDGGVCLESANSNAAETSD